MAEELHNDRRPLTHSTTVPEAADPVRAALALRDAVAARAESIDRDGAFPAEDIAALHRHGLLQAPLPTAYGGVGLGVSDAGPLRATLALLGHGSLALGRLYEGHVNALALVARYGTAANLQLLADEVAAGRPSGVWMAGEPLRLVTESTGRRVLHGRKILCSGAGHFRRPLVAAEHDGGSVMVIPSVDADSADASGWTAQGMRATSTGTVDFTGIMVRDDEIVGLPGDYLRSPYFRGGAWRVIAVQLGGLEAILDHYRTQLATSPYSDHPIQLVRFGEATIACETARLWVRQASIIAESVFEDADAVDAYVDLARNAFEGAALRVIALAQKAIGLKAFLRPNPIERICRDLMTYLRQPALDMSLISGAAFHVRRNQGLSA